MTVIRRYELFLGARPSNSISGYIRYWNNTSPILLDGIEVSLEDLSNNIIGVTSTDSDGYYEFLDVSNGSYILSIIGSGSHTFGGVTSDDASSVNSWAASPSNIERVRFLAGDVYQTGDAFMLSSIDASVIAQYVVDGDPTIFDNYPFVYFKTGELISVNNGIAFSQPNVVVDNANEDYDMYFLWAGDFDGSWTP